MEVPTNHPKYRPFCWLSMPLLIVFLFIFTGQSFAIPPVLSEAIISNVTDRSFSLTWTSDQPGQANIEIYFDAAGTVPVTSGINIKHYDVHTGNPAFDEPNRQVSINSIISSARSMGVVQVTTTGLTPATSYFIKFGVQADASLETTLCPDDGANYCSTATAGLLAFTTEQTPERTTPASELYLNDVLLKLHVSAQAGELVILSAESANYPVSAFVGDGVPAPYAILDLNNLFTSATNTSLMLMGSSIKTYGDIGEGLVVRHYKGINGSQSSIQAVSVNQQRGALMAPLAKAYGDCNSDGRINSYDHMLLANAVYGVLQEADFASVAFHPIFCDLYKERGLDNIATSVVLDSEDRTRLEALLIGKTPLMSLPEAP